MHLGSDDRDRQRKLARAARQSFTVQVRRLVAGVMKCNSSSLVSCFCVLVTMMIIFIVVLCPFVCNWHRHVHDGDCDPRRGCFRVPDSGGAVALSADRTKFDPTAVSVVIAVRTHLPPDDFLSALMHIDPSENVEFIFVVNGQRTHHHHRRRRHHRRHDSNKKNSKEDAGESPAADALADRLVEVRHRHFGSADDDAAAENNNDKNSNNKRGGRSRRSNNNAAAVDSKIQQLSDQEQENNNNNNGNANNNANRAHPSMISPRIIAAMADPHSAASNQKNGGTTYVPLGQMFAVGADAVRAESKYILFLSSFAKILEPRNFVATLLKDIKSPAPCDNWIAEDDTAYGSNISAASFFSRHVGGGGAGAAAHAGIANNKPGGAPAGGGVDHIGDVDDHKQHLDKFGHFLPHRGGPAKRRLMPAHGMGKNSNSNNNKNNEDPDQQQQSQQQITHERHDCNFGAIQCMMLEPSVGGDIQRSSPFVIADAGWTVDIGTASTDPQKFLDETIFLANREAGTPPNAGRYKRGSPPTPVDAIGPSCFIADRAALYDSGAFSLVRDVPTSVDLAVSGQKAPAIARREMTLSALFDCIVSVESVMDHMSMEEVRKATPSLRRQVRSSYSAVMEMIVLFEDMSKHTMSVERAKPRRAGFPFIGSDGTIDIEKRAADGCLAQGMSTEAKLICATERLLLVGRLVQTLTDLFVQPSISEYVVSWLPSLHLRVHHFRVAVSTTAMAVYDFGGGAGGNKPQQQHQDQKPKPRANTEIAAKLNQPTPSNGDSNNKNDEAAEDDDDEFDGAALEPAVRESIESKLLIASAQMSQTARLETWIPFLRALHHAYRGFMIVKSSATNEIMVPAVTAGSAPSSFVRVVWFAICCGCCGFSAEIAHFVRPLTERYPVSLIPGPRCFCPGMPSGFADMIARQNIKLTQYVREELYPGESIVWVAHTDPRSFVQGGFFVRRKPNYLIGRTMYEFSRIPLDWEPRLHDADELWVPCVFVQNMLLDAGLGIESEKVFIIPEGIDTNFFAPEAHQPLRFTRDSDFVTTNISWSHVFCNRDSFWATAAETAASIFNVNPEHAARSANRTWGRATPAELQQNKFFQAAQKKPRPDPFVFFSNFKWEPRKGWEFLFESYFNDFYGKQSDEDVTMLILSYVFYPHGTPKNWDVFNETYMMEEVQDFLAQKFPGRKMHEMPRFCIVAESVTEFELAQLFRGADAFVLPTRGEGWGLPTMQAMSMALPVISTNWGGSVDFTTPDTTFLIEIAGVEEVPKDSCYGWREGKKWATPSVPHLTQLMRYVVDNREHALTVGRRAREHIVRNYDDYEVVKILDRRLQQISELLE